MNEKFSLSGGYNEPLLRRQMKQNILFLFYCAAVSGLILAVCSKSSFLYPFNDWGDANCFFTMGKSLMHGKVLYRDIYDQKGPLLYLIHSAAWLISQKSFLGVYVIEVIFFSCFLWISGKTIELYLPLKATFILLPILSALVLSSPAFSHGDSAEELCLPLIALSIYSMLRYFKDAYPEAISFRTVFLNGIIAGCILLIKFNLLSFHIVWYASILIACLIRKKPGRLLLTALIFLGGIFVVLLPWLIYFFINHALADFFTSYFYNNIFLYSRIPGQTLTGLIFGHLSNVSAALLDNLQFTFFIIIGLPALLATKRFGKALIGRLSLFLGCIALMCGVFAGDIAYQYYALILSAFSVIGLIAVAGLLYSKLPRRESKLPSLCLLVFAVISLSVGFAFVRSPNTYLMSHRREDLAQYKFRDKILQTDTPTLLNYGFLDFGVYTVCGIDPTCKYFCGLNIQLPDIQKTQEAIISAKKVDYVITRHSVPEFILQNYSVVLQQEQYFEGKSDTYFLLRRLP